MTHLTATEINMRWSDYTARQEVRTNAQWINPIIERMTEIAMGAPRRKRWDQYGSYQRRQLKKWRKKQQRFSIKVPE